MLDERVMYIAVLLVVLATARYIWDMFRSDTQPKLVTWFLWSVAPLIAFKAQLESEVGAAAMLTLAVGLGPLAVFLAALRKGTFRPTRFDWICGSASAVALVLWQVTGSGMVAVLLSTAADGLAATPTLRQAYQNPKAETPLPFALFAVSAFLTLLTIKEWTWASLEAWAFSVYILVLYVTLFVLVNFEPGLRATPVRELEPTRS